MHTRLRCRTQRNVHILYSKDSIASARATQSNCEGQQLAEIEERKEVASCFSCSHVLLPDLDEARHSLAIAATAPALCVACLST